MYDSKELTNKIIGLLRIADKCDINIVDRIGALRIATLLEENGFLKAQELHKKKSSYVVKNRKKINTK